MAEKSKTSVGKRDAFGKGCANQQHRCGFLSTLGGESGGGIFRFAEDVRHLILAADVREALDLSGACGGQENGSAGCELGLDVTHAGNDIAVKARAGPGGKLELRCRTNSQGKLLDVNLGSFFERGGKLFFGPKIVSGGG